MLGDANIIGLIGLLCTIIGVIVTVLNLQKYPKIRFFLLALICGAVMAFLWVATNGFSRGGPAITVARIIELQKEAQSQVENDARKRR
jgi:hypothetical protein